MQNKIRVGLVGYGKAGSAVANILSTDPRFELCWIACRTSTGKPARHSDRTPVIGLDQQNFPELFERLPVDALVDFSSTASIHAYG